MSLIDSLTPENTEEVRPGIFVQKTNKGYRTVKPLAWNGRFRTKEQLKEVFRLRTFITLAIILFVSFSYYHDVNALQDFHNEVTEDPIAWCNKIESQQDPGFLNGGDLNETGTDSVFDNSQTVG